MKPVPPAFVRSVDRVLLFTETRAMLALLVAAIVIGPYYLVTLPATGKAGSVFLLLLGLLLAVLLLARPPAALGRWTARAAASLSLPRLLVLGIALQLAVAFATQPIASSDGAVYTGLARQLAQGVPYQDELGHRAFWPPGLPLFLAPFIRLLPGDFAAVVGANIVLFAAGAAGVWLLGRSLFDARIGMMAALLFTLWPSRLLTAAVASKENLTIALVLLGLGLFARGLSRPGAGAALACSAFAGAAFGAAGLAQPGLLLFVGALPLCFRHLNRAGWLRYAACCAVALACAMAALAPWQLRNCAVFEGRFCGVATNGGSVFYRANNPIANGGWTAEGQVRITHLPELEQNRLGFELGKQWIKEHPGDFVALGFLKLTLLLRDDRYGAYWGVLRGSGQDHAGSLAQASAARMLGYHVLNALSWAYWVLVVGLAARYLLARRAGGQSGQVLPLLYPLLYCAAVFFVFESDRRQHMIAFGPLLILACAALAGMARPAASQPRPQSRPQAAPLALERT